MIVTRRDKRHEARKPLAAALRRRYLPPWLIFDRHGRRAYTAPGDPQERFHARRCIATRGAPQRVGGGR